MSSGLDLRKRIKRRDPPKNGGRDGGNPSPLSAIDAGSPGEVKISNDHLFALNHLYHASPSIQAARTILLGQLLSSGCIIRREGRDVPLKDTFARHLHDVWCPFAKSVIDHFLQFGFCVVSLEEEAPPPFANFIKGKQMAAQSEMGPDANTQQNKPRDPPDASEARATKRPTPSDADQKHRTPKRAAVEPAQTNLVPIVPDVGQCELSFVYVGESSYRRQYRVFSTNSDSVYKQDFSSEVFFRSAPDSAGNICSPIATVFQSASFISALEELALQAEVVRARQMLVTQPVSRTQGSQNLDPANLFFDSESRAVQASATAEDDAAQAGSLALQAQMMATINRLQTSETNSRPGGSTAVPTHVPPPMPPQLFACPDRQQVVPGVRPPEARSDLVDLMRVVNDHIAAAMGVPASVIVPACANRTLLAFSLADDLSWGAPCSFAVFISALVKQTLCCGKFQHRSHSLANTRYSIEWSIVGYPNKPKFVHHSHVAHSCMRLWQFEGKFSSNSMSQLQLLNSTIQSIALSVNKVLTATYHAVYSDAKEGDELTLLTAPLASTAEVQSLYEGGLIDIESALPAALHSLGATAVEVAGAVKRRKQNDANGVDSKLLEAQNQTKVGDADVALKGAQTQKTLAEVSVVQQSASKVKAETAKIKHDAAAPHPTPGAAAGSSGAGSSGAGSSGAGSSGAGSSGAGGKK